MFSSSRHKTILRRDGAAVKVCISARVVSYSIALWSGVAAFTIWAGHETNIPSFYCYLLVVFLEYDCCILYNFYPIYL
ncbi:hypothetical protein PHAVU_004G024400 [Phaseolus vulgaris]|uniref:Uncharacterized protein n=1 Tax=Phaseolus vulgaris TaxID=3885 RepID=V7C2S4_PHAVU|nr:hypothetical protein PHAVU_004G024400g [Phaseolus vulgaris]ESW23171.1 hypothetical protein PHAVU_004G024400g [Phaseolus vulgaris]